MYVINARNVNDAYEKGIHLLRSHSITTQSRYGMVMKADMPVTTLYHSPRERVLWEPTRDCNPFLHLGESLWMLSGRNDVAFMEDLVPRFKSFSDDGETFHGAYGFRWRNFFSEDQLPPLIRLLRTEPGTRRAVLQMWSAEADLINPPDNAKDLPCNLMAKFEINDGKLDMMVYNRSNDMIWGAYGANAVHFSFLQEYIANSIGYPVGRYWQISSNFHAYTEVWKEKTAGRLDHEDKYTIADAVPFPMLVNYDSRWEDDLAHALDGNAYHDYGNSFLGDVAAPMMCVWRTWKRGDRNYAREMISSTMNRGIDWTQACLQWMDKRIK